MSRGQTPRTVEHWPRMKVRGGRRRAGSRTPQVHPRIDAQFDEISEALGFMQAGMATFAEAARNVSHVFPRFLAAFGSEGRP